MKLSDYPLLTARAIDRTASGKWRHTFDCPVCKEAFYWLDAPKRTRPRACGRCTVQIRKVARRELEHARYWGNPAYRAKKIATALARKAGGA